MRTFALLFILLIPGVLGAATIDFQFTEVDASGTGDLARSCVYSCRCNKASVCTCNNWQLVVCFDSDDGNGGDVKNGSYNVPIRADQLPVTNRTGFTSVNDDGNETNPNDVVESDTLTTP